MSNVPAIGFYEREHYYLSNFSSFAVVDRGIVWMTAEHLYQAGKFYGTNLHDTAHDVRRELQEALSAHQAKKIARANKSLVRPDWSEIKLLVMEQVLRLKFHQHEFVRDKLLSTGSAELVEDSPRDSFWGTGPAKDGHNHLGRLWMKIRDEQLMKTGA